MSNELRVTAAYLTGDGPFICHVDGACTIKALQEIESEIASEFSGFNDDGSYTFICHWFAGQYGDYGRCELSPGWELTLETFTPVPEDA